MAVLRTRPVATSLGVFCAALSTLALSAVAVPTSPTGNGVTAAEQAQLKGVTAADPTKLKGVAAADPTKLKGVTAADLAKLKGEVGVAVVDTTRKKQFFLNEKKLFPMQSVCKLPISIAIFLLADAGKLSLDDMITVRKTDITTLHSPIKEAIKGTQSDFTIRDLVRRAICDSDNTACDLLISRAGGASEVSRILTGAGISGVRIDRPEATMQPDSAHIGTFLADPRDTASPEAMINMLRKLYAGNLLSKNSTSLILEDLFNCKTGANRIIKGLPAGWKLAHKTGTGRDVAGQNAGTNDVGIMVGPKGNIIYIALFIKGSKANIEVREAFMAKVAARAAAGEL